MSKGHQGSKASKETKEKMSNSHKGQNTWTKGTKKSLEERRHMSIIMKGKNKGKKRTREMKEKNRNYHINTIWITKENKSKQIKNEEIVIYLDDGWILGRNTKESKWMNNGIITKLVEKKEINNYLLNNWKFGRIINE